MKSKNICKFIASGGDEKIITANFVFESDPAAMAKKNRLNHHVAFLITSGSGCLIFNEKTSYIHTGSLIFGFRGEESRAEPGEDLEYMYVSFDGGRADELFTRFGISPQRRAFDGFEGLIPFWKDSLSRADNDNADLISESVVTYTFSRLTGSKKQSNDITNKLVRRIEEDFTDPDLSLSSLADELGYNVKYLSHSFKQKTGMGFSQYLRMVRIKHAVFLIEHGVDSVKNIAFLCGFTDPLYFSSVFKESLGVSPKDYMTQL